MTKICYFCYPIYDLTKFNFLFRTVAAGTVALNVSYEGILLIVRLIMMKMGLLLRNIPNLRRVHEPYPIYDQTAEKPWPMAHIRKYPYTIDVYWELRLFGSYFLRKLFCCWKQKFLLSFVYIN